MIDGSLKIIYSFVIDWFIDFYAKNYVTTSTLNNKMPVNNYLYVYVKVQNAKFAIFLNEI